MSVLNADTRAWLRLYDLHTVALAGATWEEVLAWRLRTGGSLPGSGGAGGEEEGLGKLAAEFGGE